MARYQDKNKMLKNKIANPKFIITNNASTQWSIFKLFRNPSEASKFVRMSNLHSFKNHKELNLMEDGDSSPNLKIWVSSPLM